MLSDAFSLHDPYRRVVLGYVKTNVLGTKRPFYAKAGRWFWLLYFFYYYFFFCLLQRSLRKLLTLTEEENMIYDDIMYYPSKSLLRKIVFYGVLK